ncbi:NADPH-dependent FMN reductase [Nafulsella turpanensis]|uniref:NADPH-dependent FMN reductase n=1 Tax=Nafulsella turpanensis TaxID=1265690 RepID=UPI00034A1E26|nr:NADPH-dependent FMN reductase [Nafulsella turpanensis]
MKIAIISASIRHGRQTHFVSEELGRRLNASNDIEASLVDLADYAFPLFQDTHKADAPQHGADELRTILQQADGLLFVSPEYNGSYTAALKNMADHFSKAEFNKKAIGVVSVSSGAIGGMRGALQMQQLVLALYAYPIPQMMLVSEVQHKFDEEGKLTDEAFAKKLDTYLQEFLWFASAIYEKKKRGNRG